MTKIGFTKEAKDISTHCFIYIKLKLKKKKNTKKYYFGLYVFKFRLL